MRNRTAQERGLEEPRRIEIVDEAPAPADEGRVLEPRMPAPDIRIVIRHTAAPSPRMTMAARITAATML
jgi:hypothetical protein